MRKIIMTTEKENIISMIKNLPDDTTLDDIIDANLWVIQGLFSPDGVHTYQYNDKLALRFLGDDVDRNDVSLW